MADVFANRASIQVTESAANTITFTKLETAMSIFEKSAFVINRIVYEFSVSTMNLLNSDGDALSAAIVRDNGITSLSYGLPGVIHKIYLVNSVQGTATNFQQNYGTWEIDLGGLPSGGLIVPASPLYAAIQGEALGSAADCRLTFWFTVRSLKPDEYWELVESYRIIT